MSKFTNKIYIKLSAELFAELSAELSDELSKHVTHSVTVLGSGNIVNIFFNMKNAVRHRIFFNLYLSTRCPYLIYEDY